MSRQVKLRDLIVSQSALGRISSLPISARMSLTLADVLRVVNPQLEEFQKQHAVILKRYGTPKLDGNGNPIEGQYNFTPDKREALDKEYEDMLDKPVDIPFGKIKLNDLLAEKLDKDETLKLSGNEIYALGWMLRVEAQSMFEEEK